MVEFIKGVISPTQLQTLAYLIGANLLLGVVAAIARGKFELIKLADFWKRVVVVFGAYISVAIAAKGFADLDELRTAIWIALIAYLVAHIVSNIKDILGIKIPEKLQRWIER